MNLNWGKKALLRIQGRHIRILFKDCITGISSPVWNLSRMSQCSPLSYSCWMRWRSKVPQLSTLKDRAMIRVGVRTADESAALGPKGQRMLKNCRPKSVKWSQNLKTGAIGYGDEIISLVALDCVAWVWNSWTPPTKHSWTKKSCVENSKDGGRELASYSSQISIQRC